MIRTENMRFEIVMAVTVNITVNWDAMACSLVDRYHCLGKCAASIFRTEQDGGSTFL
jgi:hypothetical protein